MGYFIDTRWNCSKSDFKKLKEFVLPEILVGKLTIGTLFFEDTKVWDWRWEL